MRSPSSSVARGAADRCSGRGPLCPGATVVSAWWTSPGAAGITFTHNNGAFGKKFLPETLGAGAAFLDFNNDGRQDMLLVNGSDVARASRRRTRSTALSATRAARASPT